MTRWVRGSTAVIVAFFTVALLPRATWALIDPDVWWHIRAGEQVLQTGTVASVDTWSLTAAGLPWTSQDWLSNVLMALAYRLGDWGMTLLSLAAAAVVVGGFIVLWRAVSVRRPDAGWLGRVAWFSVALLLAGPILGVRVQVIDLLFGAIVVWLLWRYLADGRRLWPALLPFVAVLWVNLHAGWLLLFLFGGAVLVGEAADRLLRRTLTPEPMRWPRLGWLSLMLAASAVALVLNPNGLAIYSYPSYTVGIGALSDFVGEWQRASLSNLFGWLLLGFVLVGALPTLVFARRTIRLADVFILLGVTAMSVLAVRFLLITGPIGAAIVAINLSPVIAESPFGRRWSPLLARLSRPARGGLATTVNVVLIGVLLVAGVGLALARAMPASQHDEIAREFPVDAVAWLQTHDAGARVFNKYEWGGYLGLELPNQPIFIDGRADVYGDAIIRDYVRIIGLGDPAPVLERYHVDHVLYPPDTQLSAWLATSGRWELAYQDANATIWTRRNVP